MKNKIYIVQESSDVMGEISQQMIRAFACKRTAKKFIDYKNLKLNALKAKYEHFDPQLIQAKHSKIAEAKLRRFMELQSTSEYILQEVDLHF